MFYDRHARNLPSLRPNDVIRVNHNGEWRSGVVLNKHTAPRSFIIKTTQGSVLRRNRRDLVHTGEELQLCQPLIEEDWQSSTGASNDGTPNNLSQPHIEEDWHLTTGVMNANKLNNSNTRTRSGRLINRPVRFDDCL
jgi:hypothetical protein